MLKITNLKYQYQNSSDIYNYSLEVKRGEIVAILGESGSGKSTLLDLIAGFLEPISGSVKFENVELKDKKIEKRPISILFQNHNLFEHLSVQKNILLGVNRGLKDSKESISKVNEYLKEVGLLEFEYKIASSLSGGQQQRVALARVLLREKPILLLDEPFSGLDYNRRLNMLKLLKKISVQRRFCTIMVTHEIEDCNLIADKVYWVEEHTLVKAK